MASVYLGQDANVEGRRGLEDYTILGQFREKQTFSLLVEGSPHRGIAFRYLQQREPADHGNQVQDVHRISQGRHAL